ncbi:hypothetical protein GCM10022221_15050 [Actinocorallia aurea]
MIILSGLLVIGAIALLVAGIVVQDEAVLGLHGLQLMYISIAVSIVSFLCLAIGVFLRRKELFGTAPARAAAPKSRQPGRAARRAAARTVEEEPEEREEATPFAFPMPSGQVPEDAIVHVVPGRKRYHLDSCRQLAGRQTEELTYVEAQEEGFSPCTACLPDTALAARATAGPADSGDAPSGLEGEQDARRAEPFAAAETRRGEFTRTEFSSTEFSPSEFSPSEFSSPDFSRGDFSRSDRTRAEFPAPYADSPFGGDATPRAADRAERTEPVDRWSTPADPAPAPLPAPSPVEDTVTDWVPAKFPPSPLDKDYPVADEPAAGEQVPEQSDGHWQRVVEPVAAEPVNRTVRVLDTEPEPEAEPDPEGPVAVVPVVPAPAEEIVAEPVAISVPESRESDDAPAEAEPAADAEDSATYTDSAESAAEGPLVRILSGTKRYHRPDCALIEDIGEDDEDLESLPRDEAKDRGCTPCLVCQPDKEPAV